MADQPSPPATPDGADPSMEEILASIRRILNDDDAPGSTDDASGPTAREDDVLILDETMMVSPAEPVPDAAAPQSAAPASAASEIVALEVVSEAVAPEPIAAPRKAPLPNQEMQALAPAPPADLSDRPDPAQDLVGPVAAAAAALSLGTLTRTLAAGRATQVYGGGPTLEDIVRSELRPLLKEWLEDNLPPMVERLVRAEIERVVGRGGL